MYLRTKCIGKDLDPEITLYLKTLSMQIMPQSQSIFNKSVYNLYPCEERLFILQLTAKIYSLKKHNIVSSN